ncbi:MAG: D-alanyl-D-alanine carboxypeptidase [Phyllobacteriaceae bacterium]|nr:D-alanyl-D-alanine carboxypeptidase [Phyllobacteriaceae bacterium]
MQYSRLFEPARLRKAFLVGLAICLATVSSAEAGKRKFRRPHTATHVSRSNDDGGIASSGRYAAYVVDDKTGRVLFAKNEDELRHPASLTKMMTLYILFEELDKRRVTMATRFQVSAHASAQAPSKLGLRPGQSIAVEDAIRALVTKSANDVAVVIAENIGGSEAGFARRMTATARRIGMSRSTFYNASGLPNSEQYTTARDMVTLGRALQERFPTYYKFFSTRSFAWGNQVIGNHNHLMARLEGVDGIKTGYTEASGFNLVSSIWRDNRHLVASVMGGSSARQRDDHMASLLLRSIGSASSGGKVSSVFRENKRSAEADDDETSTATAFAEEAPAPMPAPAPIAVAVTPPPAPNPVTEAHAAEAPTAPIVPRAGAPRIARSDVVPLDRSAGDEHASTNRGAAVAMARAIMLPQTVAVTTEAPRPAAAPSRVASVADEPPPSLADAKISLAEVGALTTASIPARRAAEPAPQPTAVHAGWLIQIGAYDGQKAARDALSAARDKVGGSLARVEGFTENVGGSGRLWRARFAGFKDQSAADDACKALKRKKVACLALRQ